MNCDLRNRSPAVILLPDSRTRVTREYDCLNNLPKLPADILASVWLAWGTADDQYTTCRLIKQEVSGQPVEFPDTSKRPPVLTRVFEEIPVSVEIEVGSPSVSINQYGYKEVEITSLQFSTGTAIYRVPGTTTAPPPFATLVLREQHDTDDGTLRTIKRTYVEGGQLDQVDTLKFGGKLLLRRLKYLNQVPPTPTGFTLVETSKYFVNGLPIYEYGFAAGSVAAGAGGVISDQTEYKLSPDGGTTGVTVRTIAYISDLSVVSNPITTPAGFTLIEVDYSDSDGFRTWHAIYAKGVGTVSSGKDIKEGGKLVVYSITSLNVAPSTPSPTIGGTVTLIKQDSRNGAEAESGTVIYGYEWAEGQGEISKEFTNSNGGAVNFNPAAPTSSIGPVICTIRFLTASSVTTDPTTPPASFVRMAVDYQDSDGHRVWTVRFGYGAGTTVSDTEYKNLGKLTVFHKVALGSAPAAPTGPGDINLVSAKFRHEDGYDVYDYTWAEGIGVIEQRIQAREGGLRMESWTSFGYSAGTSVFTPAGIPIMIDEELMDGVTKWVVTCMQNSAGGDPTSGTALTFDSYEDFTYPGRVKAYTSSFLLYSTGTAFIYDIYQSPPVKSEVSATVTITYQTSNVLGALTYPLWNPTQWATLRAYWQGLDAYGKAKVESLFGYTAIGSAVSYVRNQIAYPNTIAILGINALQNSPGSITISGGPGDPGGTTVTILAKLEPAFVSYTGVQYYRKTIVTATIPAQAALPV